MSALPEKPSAPDGATKKHHHHHHKHRHEKPAPEPAGAPETLSAASFLVPSVSNISARRLEESGVAASYHLTDILAFLQQRAAEGKPGVSEEDIEAELDLNIKKIPKLARSLQANPEVLYENKLYSWRGMLDQLIRDRSELEDAFRYRRCIQTSELKGSYKGFEKDLKAMKEEGLIGEFNASTPKEKLYFAYDQELLAKKADVLFRNKWAATAVPGTQVDREIKLRKLGVEPLRVVAPFHRDDDDALEPVKRKRRLGARKFVNQRFFDSIAEE
jgi:hypothetical protein